MNVGVLHFAKQNSQHKLLGLGLSLLRWRGSAGFQQGLQYKQEYKVYCSQVARHLNQQKQHL